MEHFDEARTIWQTYVPPRGQAKTVQGELLRCVEKLRDEAHRNGNQNWDEDFMALVQYLRTVLLASDVFAESARTQIVIDLHRLLDFDHPETRDEPFDRLSDRVVEWCRSHPDPVPHLVNPGLRR